MIVDVHCHAWSYPEHFTPEFRQQARLARGGQEVDLTSSFEAYRAAARSVDRTIVFGGKARLSGVWVDDEYVAAYAAAHADVCIGFLSIDPTQAGWQEEMRRGHRELGLRGIKLLPMYSGFCPHDERLDPVWHYASDQGLPVILHCGTTFVAQAPLECTLPRHLDVVARRFPQVRMVAGHLGHPYEAECLVVIRKHPNLFADVSALHYRPFQLYHSLMLAQEYGVWHKLLFGTDYPFTTVDASIAGLGALNRMLEGTALPRLREEEIAALIQRDSLRLLGL
jgi:predicted TIM-barrel fold metal-dependent hydrolase